MRNAMALVRVAWLSATSYRIATLMSFAGVLASIIPLYFVSGAVQDIAAESIKTQGGQYFAFVVVGVASVYIYSTAAGAIPGAIGGNIGNGTFEALLVTRTSLPTLLLGLSGYPMILSLMRAAALLGGAMVLGARFHWLMLPPVLVILALMSLAYAGIGMVAAALVVSFRTSGPLLTVVNAGSALLGGAYYSTSVVPGWMGALTGFVPLTYALRAIRMLLLGNADLSDVMGDVSVLTLIAIATMAVGTTALWYALERARRSGTLSQY